MSPISMLLSERSHRLQPHRTFYKRQTYGDKDQLGGCQSLAVVAVGGGVDQAEHQRLSRVVKLF